MVSKKNATASPGRRTLPTPVIAGIIVVVVIAAVSVWILTQGFKAAPAAASNPGTTVYMNQSQFEQFAGPGGRYNATSNAEASTLASYIMSNATSTGSGYLINNVTGAWAASYTINSTTPSSGAGGAYSEEIVLNTSIAPKVYYEMQLSAKSQTNATMVNSSADGMTYFYISSNVFGRTGTILAGYKGSYVATYVQIGGPAVSGSDIASVVASELP
ncbi:MAG: hypothetical protein M1321_03150 [Candidatus Marsarchaeota archaeon]|jgi:hypothetical protein|nr:hypothetical protein [Candidatus Marsarchaeota archaeon]